MQNEKNNCDRNKEPLISFAPISNQQMGAKKLRKNLLYDRNKIEEAVRQVKAGCSVRSTAKLYGIPNTTLRDKVLGKFSKPNPGKDTVLTSAEEKKVADWLLDNAKRGFPVNTNRLKACVAHYIRATDRPNPFKNGVPGRKWVALFLNRHPEISRRVPSPLPKHRAAVSEHQIRSWFTEIEQYFVSEGLRGVLKNPEQIFNLDETAVRTVPTKEVVLAGCGEKYVHAKVGNSDKESYTALFGANAAGQLTPTLVLYPYKSRIPGEIWQKLPEGWSAGKTESGWMNRDTFYLFLRDVLHPWLVEQKIQFPVVLFLDGHKSHVSPQTTEFCSAKNMILICLPPNSTQVTQPLDVSFFRAFKNHWNQVLVNWRTDTSGEVLPRKEIAPLMKRAVDRMDNVQRTLANGFRRCGLYPFDPDAVNYESLVQKTCANPSSQATEPSTELSLSTETAGPVMDSSLITNDEYFTNRLESLLTSDQLSIFKSCHLTGEWHGPLIDTSLYRLWEKAKGMLNVPSTSSQTDSVEPVFHGFGDMPSTGKLKD